MNILTLCEKCRELYELSYSVKPYRVPNNTTQPEEKCSHCHKKRNDMKMYVIDRKRRGP